MRYNIVVLGVGAVAALALAACNSLPYKDDVGFLNSAQAQSTEFPVYLNGRLCTDTEGYVGLCAKRVKSTEDLVFKFDPQPYAYLLTVNCTSGVKPVPPATVPAGEGYSFTLKASDFSEFVSFTCIGEVSPQDRDPPISAKWHVRVVVYDAQYTMRERIYVTSRKGRNYLVLGQFARSGWVYDAGRWQQHNKATVVQLRGNPEEAKAYTESFAMRFNYYNMSGADGGVE